jgi:hypothetical protein
LNGVWDYEGIKGIGMEGRNLGLVGFFGVGSLGFFDGDLLSVIGGG